MTDDPTWLTAGAASGSEFDDKGNASTDSSVCPTTGNDCPGSNCGKC
jgi:hypothetical protein